MPEATPASSWNEWARRVIDDIERLEAKQEQLVADIFALRVETATLKAKAVLIGEVLLQADKKCQN